MRLRHRSPEGGEAVVLVDRPFATIGRGAMTDLPVPGPAVGLRHVYLHLNARGVFAVDLASRTGTRFDDAPIGSRSCWLRPGRGLELGGHRVELMEASPVVTEADREPAEDPLAEAIGLPTLGLLPEGHPDRPLTLLSELSFMGRSRRCAIRADGDGVARVHAVVVRMDAAFFVNLGGPALRINGETAPPAGPLRDGDRLDLGRDRFTVALRPDPAPGNALARYGPATPADAPVARALRAVQDGQDQLLRTNEQFQRALVSVVRQLYEEQAALFERHLERLDRLQSEVAELREELLRRLPTGSPPPRPAARPGLPDPQIVPPPPPPPGGPTESGRATSWLLDRLGELEGELDREARAGWRDLFSRLGPTPRGRDGA